MLLYVMRHGPAEDRAPTGRDQDRALTRTGREVVARAARALHEARRVGSAAPGLRLLASPFRRARETAEVVASASPVPVEVELHDDLGADAGLPLGLVGALAAEGGDALLVGHQPVVEALVHELCHPQRAPLPGGFRTALIVALEGVGSGGGWRPAALFDPHAPLPGEKPGKS
jgi:phosphohistidine phosphatase